MNDPTPPEFWSEGERPIGPGDFAAQPGTDFPGAPAGYAAAAESFPFARAVEVGVLGVTDVPFARPSSADGSPPLSPRAASPWWAGLDVLLVMATVLVGGFLITIAVALAMNTADEQALSIPSTVLMGSSAIAVCLALLGKRGLSLRSIGLTRRGLALDILIGCGSYLFACAILLVMGFIMLLLIPEELQRSTEYSHEAMKRALPALSLGGSILFMSFVGFWEEVVFRGFILTRLHVIMRHWWLTIPVGAVLFAMGHAWQGGLGVIQTGVLGLVLGGLFAWRKSITPGLVLHVLNNVISMLLLNTF